MEVRRSPGARSYLDEVKRVLDALPAQLEPLVAALFDAYKEDRTVFVIGNGGSAAAATHFGQDLCKASIPNLAVTKRLRALPLTDNVSFITALANDEGYERIFVEQLITLGRPGDMVLAISGSGNSPNILKAIEHASSVGLTTIGVTGFAGGKLARMVDVHVNVPSDDMGLVEGVHSVLFHLTVSELRWRIEDHLSGR